MKKVAIIGMGCRFPGGANNPREFWELIKQGKDLTSDVPKDRWDIETFYNEDKSVPGKMYTFHGGFLNEIDKFDAQFFGISPREASYLDPQQRLLLEVTWEAFEDAGINPRSLAETNVGVYVGGFTLDYKVLQFSSGNRELMDAHTATGSMMTMLSNRISYAFDFRGPSMSVDTACSSSLVSIHLACQSLINNECTVAVAGGVNVITTPEYTIAESKGGLLSPDGRCKTFDSSANGYARGEGAGVVILKPLDKALEDGDEIYAVISGTAVNSDGQTNGITVPRGEAQEAVMRAAYERAGISPGKLSYIEAHGTGTPIGDPIEANAIANVLKSDRKSDDKCLIGSVKTNMGHLEAAAGIASVIKTSLVLKNKLVPPHLHLKNPNAKIPFEDLCLRVPTKLEKLPESNEPLVAGVNGFGFGGTNAHVVLEEAPAKQSSKKVDYKNNGFPQVVPISASTKNALESLAKSYKDFVSENIDNPEVTLEDIGYSASIKRAHQNYRLAVVANSKEDFIKELDEYLQGNAPLQVIKGDALKAHNKLVFVYTGMGAIWWAMGRQLLEKSKVFRDIVEKCDAFIKEYAGWSLMEELTADEENSKLDQPQFAQPANFALQIGLTALWESLGIKPDVVVGHSVGEVSAVYASGALSFEDALIVSVNRGLAQQKVINNGTMLAVGLSNEEASEIISKFNKEGETVVSVAAINSSKSVTLAGNADVLEEIRKGLEEKDVFARFLRVNVAYHSHIMEPLKDDLIESLKTIKPRKEKIKIYSTVTGKIADGTEFTADYWWHNVRQPVNFKDAMNSIIQDGYNLFVEIGPHKVLSSSISECLKDNDKEGEVFVSILRKKDEMLAIGRCLGNLYCVGYPFKWQDYYNKSGNFVKIPTYQWQNERYWVETEDSKAIRLGLDKNPILGQRKKTPMPTWENEVSIKKYGFLKDHQIQGATVFPGAAYVQMGQACAEELYGENEYVIENIKFNKSMFLDDVKPTVTQLNFNTEEGKFRIYSRPLAGEKKWTEHASGDITKKLNCINPKAVNIDEIKLNCKDTVLRDNCYSKFYDNGFQYGDNFRGVLELWKNENEVLAKVNLPAIDDNSDSGYILHPTTLDIFFHGMVEILCSLESEQDSKNIFLPVGINSVKVYSKPKSIMWTYSVVTERNDDFIIGDIKAFDEDGNIAVEINGFNAKSIETQESSNSKDLNKWLFELEWVEKEHESEVNDKEENEGVWLILSNNDINQRKVANKIKENGGDYVFVKFGDAYSVKEDEKTYYVNPLETSDFSKLFESVRISLNTDISGIVHMWSMDNNLGDEVTDDTFTQYENVGCISVMSIAQAVQKSNITPKLWIITRGSQDVNGIMSIDGVAQSPIWGIGRVLLHQELPVLAGGILDLDPSSENIEEQLEMAFNEIWNPDEDDQVAFRNGQRFVARLQHKRKETTSLPVHFKANASYMVTGAFGSLGVVVTKWMVEHGARQLILVSRTKFPPRSEWNSISAENSLSKKISLIKSLENMGVTVHTAGIDISDRDKLAEYVDNYEKEGWPSILGVINTAGIVEDRLIQNMDLDNFRRVLKPKINGSWNLHKIFENRNLDFLVLFSSTASIVVSIGQSNYASGNSFIDSLAHYRKTKNLPVVSINWGPWDKVGMASRLNLIGYYEAKGVGPIGPSQGVEIIGRLLGQESPQVAVIPATWSLICKSYPVNEGPKMLKNLRDKELEEQNLQNQEAEKSNEPDDIVKEIIESDESERKSIVASHLQHIISLVLRFETSKLDIEQPLNTLGLDSMMATEIKNRIENSMKINISIVDLLKGLSVVQLAETVLKKIEEKAAVEAAANLDLSIEEIAASKVVQDEGLEVVEDLINKIDELSEEEIQKMLNE